MKKSVLPVLGAAALLGGASLAYAQAPSPYGQPMPGTQPEMRQRPAHQQPTQEEIREREQQMRDRSMQRQQPSGQAGTGEMQRQQRSGQADTGEMTGRRVRNPRNATEILNTLSAEGYRPTSEFERVGNAWQIDAVRQDGQNVTVLVDPQTRAIRETR